MGFVAITMTTRMMTLPAHQDQLKFPPLILVIPGGSSNSVLTLKHQIIHVKFIKNEQRGQGKPAASSNKMFLNRVMTW